MENENTQDVVLNERDAIINNAMIIADTADMLVDDPEKLLDKLNKVLPDNFDEACTKLVELGEKDPKFVQQLFALFALSEEVELEPLEEPKKMTKEEMQAEVEKEKEEAEIKEGIERIVAKIKAVK